MVNSIVVASKAISLHPLGEPSELPDEPSPEFASVDSYADHCKIHCVPDKEVITLVHLPFFIDFLTEDSRPGAFGKRSSLGC